MITSTKIFEVFHMIVNLFIKNELSHETFQTSKPTHRMSSNFMEFDPKQLRNKAKSTKSILYHFNVNHSTIKINQNKAIVFLLSTLMSLNLSNLSLYTRSMIEQSSVCMK